ncbi:P-loop containing nucleoside triphosphate hydrolase protein [Lyophyllum atratum]|nr:P-loop containing nucleoside triphosphate hydrolase protein [Lyophyllum atratum]
MAKGKGARKRNKGKKLDIFLEDPKETDRVIVLMGPTGAGKSSFVNKLLDDTVASVGDDLESHTEQIQPFIFAHPTGRVIVIDTPGLDNTSIDDQEILSRIADWLALSHAAQMKLAGVIYFHKINDQRMARTMTQNLVLFEALSGKSVSKKTVLTTPRWNGVSREEGERYEAQMRDNSWKETLAVGSRMFPLQDVEYSARDIVEFILGNDIPDAGPISTTREMAEDRRESNGDSSKVRGVLYRFLSFLRDLSEGQINSVLQKSPTKQRWKKLVQKSDSFMQNPAANDCVILILGLTGAGKSTFINAYIGETLASVGHGSVSHTQHVQSFPIPDPAALPPRRIVVVDTPGFNPTHLSGMEILRRIAIWLARSYTAHMKLAGVIHLVNISESRTKKTKDYLDVCHKLCGQDASRKVVLATTKWDEVTDQGWAEEQERAVKGWWEELYGPGSRMARFQNTSTSAADIVRSALDENDLTPIRIQQELVDKGKPFGGTAAACSLLRSGNGSAAQR